MKSPFTFFVAGMALFLTSATARADFETWTNKDGKSAELEIAGVDEGATGTKVRFITKAGKEVTLKLEDLAGDARARVKEWQKQPPLKATFAYVKRREDANDPSIQFVFDLKGEIALPSHPARISNMKAMVGEKELEVRQWMSIVDDGGYGEDPFTQGAAHSRRKWTLVITAEGDFSGVAVENCEFSAEVEVTCGKSPKEVSALFPLPKSGSPSDEVEKILDPLSVKVGTFTGPDFKRPTKKEKKDGTMAEVVTGYHIMAGKKARAEDGNDQWDFSPIFHRAFVVKGREYLSSIDKSKATDPIQVVVKYWSESYEMPLRLTKAASNKGRTPPKDIGDGVQRDGGGGADPFGG